jgi:ubiquinone/menaquinone biosynthesis C-methylase UbiE
MNADERVIAGFGDEWQRFDQSVLSDRELSQLFEGYFGIFPFKTLTTKSIGFDLGCGTGRWARFVAPRVKTLHCIDPSSAIEIAKKNLASYKNCVFHKSSVDDMPISSCSMDFGYSLGVLHHIPDTQAALKACVGKLKPQAPFLLYLYYSFDNRPAWFRFIWLISNGVRIFVSKLPFSCRYWASQLIALLIYWPLARLIFLLSKIGINTKDIPLFLYKDKSFYTMRTDALDRFGTRLEQRFSKKEIHQMMEEAGLERITFSDDMPFWCAVGYKKI